MQQYVTVLQHLNTYGSITPLEAMENYGVMRLAAVIYTLKELGEPIKTEMVNGKNRYGKPVRYARYVKGDAK